MSPELAGLENLMMDEPLMYHAAQDINTATPYWTINSPVVPQSTIRATGGLLPKLPTFIPTGVRQRSLIRQEMGERGVLGICLDVHMTATGAMERSRIEQERDIGLLKRVIDHWEPTSFPKSRQFDGLVRSLVLAALFEADAQDAP